MHFALHLCTLSVPFILLDLKHANVKRCFAGAAIIASQAPAVGS